MDNAPTITTRRLILRPWREADREPFAAMNADARVMEFFTKTLSHAESDAMVDRMCSHMADNGFGLWAVELAASGEFAGLIGLWKPTFDAPFMPAIEVGWRLAHHIWGQGYAPEGGRAALDFGFKRLGLREIVSVTSVSNMRSRRVMEKLGMTRSAADDFLHPLVEVGHPLRPHVCYRIQALSRDSRPP
jgi:RimJ/RimL family protein N-acetyltransferase